MIDRYSRPVMASVFTDQTRMDLWLAIEQAALAALVAEGIAPRAAYDELAAVDRVDVEAVRAREAEIHHDLAAFVDVVGAAAPGAASWLHWGLTSSDVVDTALSLQLVQAGGLIVEGVRGLQRAVAARAHEHRDTVMLGRTHGMPAETITFGSKLAGWWHGLRRDEERIQAALSGCAVGKLSGAVGLYTGVPQPVERRVLDALGLGRDPSATQVVQRDRHAAVVAALGICASTLDRIALEVRHLQRAEVGEASEPFGRGQKGSSAMPHKRNPITAERICGLARVVRANVGVAMDDVALWHERDISHSSAERVILPDSFLALDYMLDRATWMVDGMVVDAERMRANVDAQRGLVRSQAVLLALAAAGMARDEAYRIVQGAAARVHAGEADHLAAALEGEDRVVDAVGGVDQLAQLCDATQVPPGVAAAFEGVPAIAVAAG